MPVRRRAYQSSDLFLDLRSVDVNGLETAMAFYTGSSVSIMSKNNWWKIDRLKQNQCPRCSEVLGGIPIN